MVNRGTNAFLHFTVKNETLEKHFEYVSRLTEELKPGQGIGGAIPIDNDQPYS